MKRTTVILPPEVHERVRRDARRRGVSVAQIVREVLEATYPAEPKQPLSFIGIGDGPPTDIRNHTRELAGEAMAAHHAERERRRSRRRAG